MIECNVTNTFVVEEVAVNGVLKTVRKRDDNNQPIRTNTIKITTSVDTEFPEILSQKRILSFSNEIENLKFVPNTDYRLASKPTKYDKTNTHSALFKPLPKSLKMKKW